MNHWLNDEQKMLRTEIRDFAEREIAPAVQELNEKEESSRKIIKKMADLGLFGMFVSEDYDGVGMDYLSFCVAVEEISRVDFSHGLTVASANTLGIGPIYDYGSEEQKERWLPKLCRGKELAAFIPGNPNKTTKKSNSDIKAELNDKEIVINGRGNMVANSTLRMAGLSIVQATTGPDNNGEKRITTLLVPKKTAGMTTSKVTKKMVCRAADLGDISFEDCKLPLENLLGKEGEGAKQLQEITDNKRLAYAAIALGGAQGSYEMALKYSKQRVVFGKPISEFSVNADKLANMATEIEAARSLLYQACQLKDAGKSYGKEAAMAKIFCTNMMGNVVDEMVQLHGAYGLSNEYPAERFFRDYQFLITDQDSPDVLRNFISRKINCFKNAS